MIRNICKGLKSPVIQVILVMFAAGGCGYTTRSLIADKYHTIYIRPFVNKIDVTKEGDAANRYKIYRPLLETDVTKAVINRYMIDGNLKTAKNDAADLALEGELVEYRREPLRYTSADNVEEYRISIVVNITLWDKKENKKLWQENNFIGDTSFFTTGSNAKSENSAINDALNDLGRRIVERTVDQW
ncbi:MAG: LptE family protein [Candidatus Omnitrophica bacterium]|nr:LptE family protein [Candidatus Omnitrophota bacterium]